MTPPSAHRTRWANAKASVSASDPNGSHATLVRNSKWARPSWPARILHVPHAFSLALNDRPKPEHNTHRTRDGAEINALPPPPPPTPPPNTHSPPSNGSQTPSRVASGVANTVDPTAYTVCAGGGVLPGSFGNPAIPCGATFRNPPLDSILERASSCDAANRESDPRSTPPSLSAHRTHGLWVGGERAIPAITRN